VLAAAVYLLEVGQSLLEASPCCCCLYLIALCLIRTLLVALFALGLLLLSTHRAGAAGWACGACAERCWAACALRCHDWRPVGSRQAQQDVQDTGALH
jgi:hypothetical protein